MVTGAQGHQHPSPSILVPPVVVTVAVKVVPSIPAVRRLFQVQAAVVVVVVRSLVAPLVRAGPVPLGT